MGKTIKYDIRDFNWVKELNTFFAYNKCLWEMSGEYKCPFPTGRKQFFIENTKTGGFCRFRLESENVETQWCEYTDDSGKGEWAEFNSLLFSSEDGILCKIYL